MAENLTAAALGQHKRLHLLSSLEKLLPVGISIAVVILWSLGAGMRFTNVHASLLKPDCCPWAA